MAISTSTKLSVQAAAGKLYLFAAKTAFSSSTLGDKIIELFALLYTDGSKKQVLNSVSPWAVLNADGIKCKLKQEPVKFDPSDGAPYTIGYQFLGADMEVSVNDVTCAKLLEILSGTTSSQVTIAAGAGTPGQLINAHGGEVTPIIYTAIYRYPSRAFAGQYDHVLIPFATFDIDTEYNLNKKDVRSIKVKINADVNEDLLVAPDSGRPINWIEHRTTALPSS